MDPCLYSRRTDNGLSLYLVLYVDDLIYAGDRSMAVLLKTELGRQYKVIHDGAARWISISEIKVTKDRRARLLHLSQGLYLLDMLKRFNMSGCKPVQTPMEPATYLSNEISPTSPAERQEMADKPYRELIRSPLYAANCTRPAQEGTHLRQLLVDLGQHTSITRPTEFAGDNQGSLFLA